MANGYAWSCALVLAAAMVPAQGQSGDLAPLQQMLDAQFKVTTVTSDRSDITTPGTIVQIDKPGMVMYAVASPAAPSNTYKNGKIGQGWGGFGTDLLITTAMAGNGTASDIPHRTFSAGEKVWITGVVAKKDGIVFQLYSDPYDGIRYYGNVKIPYKKKKEVPSVQDAQQLIAEVLTLVPAEDQGAQASAPAPPPPAAKTETAGAPPPAPLPSIAPPPPPADAPQPPPQTIALGQTMNQVIAVMGQPKSVTAQSGKTVFTYPDIKVIFTDGKVSDVQ